MSESCLLFQHLTHSCPNSNYRPLSLKGVGYALAALSLTATLAAISHIEIKLLQCITCHSNSKMRLNINHSLLSCLLSLTGKSDKISFSVVGENR